MEFWMTLSALAALFFCYGYIRGFFKRIIMTHKLKKCCKRNGYTFKKTGSIFTWNRSEKVSFRIENGNTVYLIKLMGSVHKLETFYLNTQGTYTVQRIVPLAVGKGGSVSYTKNSREKSLPEVDWYQGEEPDWTKIYIPIFLFCPAPMEIRIIKGEAKKESPLIGSGAIGDAYMESLKKRRLNTDREYGGWASGGYSYIAGSSKTHSGEAIGGIYLYGTQDLIKILDDRGRHLE